ncbi:hypothetical protein AAMO2058_000474300 [Amorphochlora amoebiformis]
MAGTSPTTLSLLICISGLVRSSEENTLIRRDGFRHPPQYAPILLNDHLQEETPECENPCDHGECKSSNGTSKCDCYCEYTGTQCDKKVDGYCEKDDDCLNKQKCDLKYSGFGRNNKSCTWKQCNCKGGWGGPKCGINMSACWDGTLMCSNNGACSKRKENNKETYYCACNEPFQEPYCKAPLGSIAWNWTTVSLVVIGLLAAAVVLERIWTCGRKAILKLQGRQGFRRVPGEDYPDDLDDHDRQLGEFGDAELEPVESGRGIFPPVESVSADLSE